MEAAWLRNLARFRIWAHRTRIPSTRGRVFTGDMSIYYQACGSGDVNHLILEFLDDLNH